MNESKNKIYKYVNVKQVTVFLSIADIFINQQYGLIIF